VRVTADPKWRRYLFVAEGYGGINLDGAALGGGM